jgi:murein DD-endopeptidase MepM/ murein hydrolase activator NlpD
VPRSPRRRSPGLVLATLVAALATGALTFAPSPPAVSAPASAATSEVRHQPPVPGEVWRAFEPPGTAYGAGHRGVDLGAAPGDPIQASAAGVVVHAGPIAGTTWVSIDHADGLRTAYGPLAAPRVTAGQHVAAAQAIGTLAPGGHGHEGRDRGLHFSVRRDGDYLDPLALFAGGVPSLAGTGSTTPLAAPRAAVPGPPTPIW